MAKKEFDFSGFTSVEARNAMKVEIVRGDAYSVVLEAVEDIIDEVKVEMTGNSLKAKFETRFGHIGLLFKQVSSPKLIVTMPEIISLELAAATRGSVSGFSGGESFQATLAGASKLSGDISCDSLSLDGGAASVFELSGNAGKAQIDLSAASNADLSKMTVGDANVKLSSASGITINLTGKLDADISGASNFRWAGTPAMGDIRVTGASSFSKK